jgi:hypothetical protein
MLRLPCSETQTAAQHPDFSCDACGLTLDRDQNAAINLRQQVARSGGETENGRGADRKTPILGQVAVKRQPGTVIAGQTGTVHRKVGPSDVPRSSTNDHYADDGFANQLTHPKVWGCQLS